MGSQAELPDFGPYRVLELLGQGGMGVVHRAHDTANDRLVALKRLSPSTTDPEYRARFQREARLAASLDHPNVVPVHDSGEIDGTLFLDMALVEGTDLRRALGAGSVDRDRALDVLGQVALALDAAHERGLVHRDVKPSNVLLTQTWHAYLADFGIARETSPEATALTRSGDLIGSWDYMAPERLSAAPVDGRSDQYSLACVLFECLTGRLPHPAADPAAKVAAHLLQPPPAPSVFNPTVTPGLDAVVLRGLAKDPARRFGSSGELMTAAREAAYAGATARAARPTLPGPDVERDQGRLVRAVLRAGARKPPTRVLRREAAPTAPYPGLSGFERADAELFHGRDHVVTDLLVRLAEQVGGGEPVVLVGASGSGKSSVLRAGVLPALALDGDRDWPQVVLTPGADPIANLARAIGPHTSVVPAEWARLLREEPASFGELCGRTTTAERPVIVVDQLEELFTHGAPEADRLAFATALANAKPALVVLAVRADLVDRCIELAPLRPALASPVLLGPMDATELRQAIVTPARDFGVDVEPGLPERMIADLGVRGDIGYDPGALPRLAHALRESWHHRQGPVLTLAAYRRAGGIDGAVARTAEEIHARLDPGQRQELRRVLLRLVAVLDDGAVVRRRVDPHELAAHRHVLDQLIAARLVTVDGTGARLSHEALLTAWPRLRDWIEEDRAGLVQHRRFTDAVRAWAESGRHDDDLYRGVRLTALTGWLEQSRDRVRLRPEEQEFLARSTAAEQAGRLTERRRATRLRGMVAALSALLVVASVAGVVATRSRQTARAQRDVAESQQRQNLSRQLAAESALARDVDPRRAALAALGAWHAGDTVEGRSALLGARVDSYRGRLTGHVGAVSGLAVSGDGAVAATGGRDGSLRLWDVPERRELALLDEDGGWYRTVAMSADGGLLATANVTTRKAELWDVAGRERLFTVPDDAADIALTPDGRAFAAYTGRGVVVWDTGTLAERAVFPAAASIRMVFSPDGALIALADGDGVAVHRVSDGARVATLEGHTAEVNSLSFHPSGGVLASGAMDSQVRLWDTSSWTERRVLSTSDLGIASLAFSPDGRSLVAGVVGNSVYGWDPDSGEVLARLPVGSVTTFGVAVTGDGHTLLTSDSDGAVTLWSYGRSALGSRAGAITGAAFQPGGDLLAAVGANGSVGLWDSTTGDVVRQTAGHAAEVHDVAFSPDGSEFATVDIGGEVVVWTTATGAEARRFSRPGTEFTSVAFSPDGGTIAVAGRTPAEADHGEDRDELLLLDAADLGVATRRPTRAEPRNPQGNEVDRNFVTGIAFSPDSRTLALTLSAGRVGLWNLADPGAELTTLPGHDGLAVDVEFSPDGELLASGGSDRVVRLWRVRDGARAGEITGHDATVRRVAFSPDGRTLATASQDTVLRLWDVAGRRLLARLDRHDDELNDVAFDGGGERVASASADGTTRVWQLSEERAAEVLCGVFDRGTIAEEWSRLGPERGSPPDCGR
ncbi:protein kinase domain-containing protein [Saccharothrix xinjiangensis]|uniref:Protein kinase n=1 Tax=Saccharothrix xinjiangensis TaxID=204798 RepID=A0ABV9Y145_9PSEU